MMRFVDLHHKHQQSQLAVEELEKKKSRFCLAKVIRIWRKTKQQWLMLLHEKWQHHHVPHLSIIIVVIVDRPCLLLHVQCEINWWWFVGAALWWIFVCLLTEKAGAIFAVLVFLSVWRFAEISKSTCLAQSKEHQPCNLEVVSLNLTARNLRLLQIFKHFWRNFVCKWGVRPLGISSFCGSISVKQLSPSKLEMSSRANNVSSKGGAISSN